jgi:hypothetical protein
MLHPIRISCSISTGETKELIGLTNSTAWGLDLELVSG